MIKQRSIWMGHRACMGKKKSELRVLVGNPEEERH
jgi:hypothetical protein